MSIEAAASVRSSVRTSVAQIPQMQRVIVALAAVVALLAVAPTAVEAKKNKKPAPPRVYFVNQSAPACAQPKRARAR